jgi:CRP-like cAMP-binding protein
MKSRAASNLWRLLSLFAYTAPRESTGTKRLAVKDGGVASVTRVRLTRLWTNKTPFAARATCGRGTLSQIMQSNGMSAGVQALLTKLELFATIDAQARTALSGLLNRAEVTIGRGQDLMTQGGVRSDGYVILTGWAARSKTLPDGRRQILSFLTPGDAIGLFGAITPMATSSVTALSDLTAVPFAPAKVVRTIAQAPRLGAALVWAAGREQEILGEHLVSLGRRSARERVAHLFLELWARLTVRGLTSGDQLYVPLTQQIIADALGLSVVHVNRTLRQLGAEGLLVVKRESVTLLNIDQLRQVTGFDDDYLMHHAMPGDLDMELTRLESSGGA